MSDSQSSVLDETNEFIRQIDVENREIEKQISELLGKELEPRKTNLSFGANEGKYLQKIKHLERQLDEARNTIGELNEILQEKDEKLQEILRGNPLTLKDLNLSGSSSSFLYANTTPWNENKVKELQKTLSEERAAMKKLQELNRNLLLKLKGSPRNHLPEVKMRGVLEENSKLNSTVDNLKTEILGQDTIIQTNIRKYNELLKSSQLFEERTRSLYKANQKLNRNIRELLENK